MRRLIREIHRRSLWQVLGLYVAGSWVALQVVNEVVDSVALPGWVSGAAVVLLILGFPIVLATAFVQQGAGADGGAAAGGSPRPESVPGDAGRPVPAGGPAPAGAPISPPPRARSHRWLTWRNAVVGGVGAFALLGISTAAYVASRTLGIGPAATLVARGVLDSEDRILLADFSNRTADSLLAGVVTEALRIDLAQSNVVRLAEQSLVASGLDRMELPPETRVDATLGRLLAQREGIKAVLTGEIGAVGSNYVLTAQLLEPATGEVLFSHRETADGEDRIIEGINRLSRRIRERIGESLASIRGAPPLERVTTSDLEALRLYTQAVRAIEFEADDTRGLALLDEATERDTAFAAAYRKIGVTLSNRGEQRDRLVAALAEAYAHRDRLTRSERYMTVASYESSVNGNLQAAATAYENLLESDPTYYPALNNLAVVNFGLRDLEQAEDFARRAAEVDVSSPFPLDNLLWALAALGRLDEARATLDTADARFPDYPLNVAQRGQLAWLEGDGDRAVAAFDALLERRSVDPYFVQMANRLLAGVAAARGRLVEAESRFEASMRAAIGRGVLEGYYESALARARIELEGRRDTAAALRAVEEALREHPFETMTPADRPYLPVADVFASAGRLDRARGLVDAFEAEVDPGVRTPDRERALLRTQALVALGEGRTDDAIDLIRRSDTGGCLPCALPYLANAFERAGEADSAAAAYEAYVTMSWMDRIYLDHAELPRALERLGQLYDERGDLENAANYYARFVELWAEADEELQPRVRAARARLEAIVRERG